MLSGEHPIELSGDGIMRQAKMTAHDYLLAGISNIDELFGKGTARKHPELVAAYAQIAAIDGGAAIIAQQVRAGVEAIAEAIRDCREDLRTDHPLQGETFRGLTEALSAIAQAIDDHKDRAGPNRTNPDLPDNGRRLVEAMRAFLDSSDGDDGKHIIAMQAYVDEMQAILDEVIQRHDGEPAQP